MIPISHADGLGASTAKERNNTSTKRMSVGVKKPWVPRTMLDVENPVATVTATNSNPIRVAAAVPAIRKKLSQPWSIGKQFSPSATFLYCELREIRGGKLDSSLVVLVGLVRVTGKSKVGCPEIDGVNRTYHM